VAQQARIFEVELARPAEAIIVAVNAVIARHR
jgi:hypothetical protein